MTDPQPATSLDQLALWLKSRPATAPAPARKRAEPAAQSPQDQRRAANAAVHQALDRTDPLAKVMAELEEAARWRPSALVLLQTHQQCRCGSSTFSTQGLFLRRQHVITGARRLVRIEFFPHHEGLPHELETIEEHLDICAICFIEHAALQDVGTQDPQQSLWPNTLHRAPRIGTHHVASGSHAVVVALRAATALEKAQAEEERQAALEIIRHEGLDLVLEPAAPAALAVLAL